MQRLALGYQQEGNLENAAAKVASRNPIAQKRNMKIVFLLQQTGKCAPEPKFCAVLFPKTHFGILL